MLDRLPTPAADPLWAAASAFATDQRPHRLDLTVGVYRDDNGHTPTMTAVLLAEQHLLECAPSKAYRGLAGNGAFNDAMTALILGDPDLCARATTVQTAAGSGALRLLAALVAAAQPRGAVWISDPAYANHEPVLLAAGVEVRHYTYLDKHLQLDADTMFADLAQARRGDVVLIQGSAHNPTGTDLTPEAWEALTGLCNRAGLVPFIDLAYAGLADSLDTDLAPVRAILTDTPEALVAVSCSKNFGLYAERTRMRHRRRIITDTPSPHHVGDRDHSQDHLLHATRARRSHRGHNPARPRHDPKLARRAHRNASTAHEEPRRPRPRAAVRRRSRDRRHPRGPTRHVQPAASQPHADATTS